MFYGLLVENIKHCTPFAKSLIVSGLLNGSLRVYQKQINDEFF